MTRSVLRISDLSEAEIVNILDVSAASGPPQIFANKGVALVFEHPSARTRNAAEMAVVQLGGHPIAIRGEEVGIDTRESAEDVARTLGSYHSLIGARVVRHGVLERMATALAPYDVPVVNLLSDVEHPSQALADLLTIKQVFGAFDGKVVSFIGDANNVCRSLAEACVRVGMEFRIAAPSGFTMSDDEIVAINAMGKGRIVVGSPQDVAEGAHVLYTDVWVSMGDRDAEQKRAAFSGFTIDAALVAAASPDAVVLHCLPAHRGEEITAEVMEGPRSRVWQQAENRMHSLRGLLSFAYTADANGADA